MKRNNKILHYRGLN
ncbi:hypothetical protein U9Z47_02645 [Escherichia coli]